jgi:transcriptional regulator with XRE-family HTH domain
MSAAIFRDEGRDVYTDSQSHLRADARSDILGGTTTGPEAFDRLRLGRRLREVRENYGWTRADVERLSDGRWSAPALGTYERGERLMTAVGLCAVAEFYGVPAMSLLECPPPAPPLRLPDGPLAVDTVRLGESGRWPVLARFVDAVARARGAEGERFLVLRRSDLPRLAGAHGLSVELFIDRLRRQRLIAVGRGAAAGAPGALSVLAGRVQ